MSCSSPKNLYDKPCRNDVLCGNLLNRVFRTCWSATCVSLILWNTRYLERAIAALREVEEVPDQLLVHLSPLGWEHVNLTGDYVWGGQHSMSENTDGLRALRTPQEALATAA